MDISKLDAGAVAPKRAAFPLAPMFERLHREFGPLAAAKGLRFTVVPTRAWVDSDPLLLERILANLASNAVRYTARGGVVIGARRRAGRMLLQVWDSGVGIPARERERIFEEFYQIGNAARHGSQGMGLGLAIIRRLAMLLGHTVRIDSEPGKGSCFGVEVAPAAPVNTTTGAQPARATRATTLTGACIAVVDDESIVVEGMQALFAAWGAQVVGAASGEAMLTALGEIEAYPDLLIADYRLGQDELGTEVVARLRRELGLPIPALVISGDSSATTLERLRCCGVDFLLKPVLPEELKTEAERLLASRPPAPLLAGISGEHRETFTSAAG